jgi:hypothetical protein
MFSLPGLILDFLELALDLDDLSFKARLIEKLGV